MKRAILVALAAVVGCGKGDKSSAPPAPQTAAAKPAPVVADAATVDAFMPPPDADLSLELPKKPVLAADVLGKTRDRLRARFGKATNDYPSEGLWFDVEGATLMVEFDATGKAGKVSLLADHNMETTDAEQRAVIAWFGVDPDRDDWEYDDSLHVVSVWAPGARAAADERKRIGDALGDYMHNVGAGSGHARGELATYLLIRVPYKKPCNASILQRYRRGLEEDAQVNLAKLGFAKMTCDLDGPAIMIR